MEESFSLTWEDSGTVVQNEEVICGIEETEILPGQTEEFRGTEVIPQNGQEMQGGNIMYITDDNVLVMQESSENSFPQHFMDCQVTEEVVAEQWEENCPEEIVVGSEEAIGISGEQASVEDVEIPLPTDQDEYTAARPYPCDFCSRRFRKKANLMNHMVAHQTDRPHGCNLCGVRYIRKCDLMNHLKIHAYIPEPENLDEEEMQPLDDSDPEKYRKNRRTFNKKRKKQKVKEEFESFEADEVAASSSRNYYTSEELMDVKSFEYLPSESSQLPELRYPVTDHKKPFVCQHCGVGFAREKALASHARVHGGDSPFECQKCNEMFWDMNSMREHWRTKHGGLEDYDDDEDDDYSEEDHKYGTFYCTTCGLSFHRQDNLKRHQRVHVKDELINQPELGHICNVCGESFPEALDLLAHAEIHARSSEHRCMICGEDFEDDQGCAVHVQEKHGNDLPPNTCMLCGRQCKDRRALLKHSWEHSKEKVFSCSKCAKTFHNKARLKRHMLSHRNKVVPCDVCGEEFPDGRTLMNHRHSHNSVSGRQFPCRECGKTFGSRSSQQIHIRIHTGERPYGCRFCWKAFADGGTLRKHERIHTGEKPYACAVCPRAFNQRVVLREHIRSHHSGPDPRYTHSMTPYCCSVCSDMFATSQDLIVHLIHHCDMNTQMKRQPQVGPRKYKRRRKLKPHELDLLSHRLEDEPELEEPQQDVPMPEYEIDMEKKRKVVRKVKKSSPKQEPIHFEENYLEQETFAETVSVEESPPPPSLINSKMQTIIKSKKKLKNDNVIPPSRPKMIHTQKTRVPAEPGEDGRVRHRTRTTITRTQPTELKSATGERIRPRTKNVSYHVFNSDKLPLATFPEDVTAVNNLLKQDQATLEEGNNSNGLLYLDQVETPEVAAEQTVEFDEPVPTNLIRVHRKPSTRQSTRKANSLKPGRHIIGPGSKVRLVKGGMLVKKKVKEEKIELEEEVVIKQEENYEQHEEQVIHEIADEFVISENRHDETEAVEQQEEISDNQASLVSGVHYEQAVQRQKQQAEEQFFDPRHEMVDPSPLHELAELSMQHAQNLFKCEMCSAVFSDRAQLLVHVPIHI